MQDCFRTRLSSTRLKDANGDMLEGQGGRILKSTAKRDRHSKINTAKGPRDRRVRLSAHTAIQFYDVQDRLGYDQPSKAVDWLIEKAKASIDALDSLPTQNLAAATSAETSSQEQQEQEFEEQSRFDLQDESDNANRRLMMNAAMGSYRYDFEKIQHFNNDPIASSGCYANSLDMPSISSHFQSYPSGLMNSKTICHTQNLLPSVQDQSLIEDQNDQSMFFTSSLCLNTTPAHCFDKMLPEMTQFQRISSWNPYSVRNGVVDYNSSAAISHPVLPQDQLFSSRGTLQSENLPPVLASMSMPMSAAAPQQITSLKSSSIPSNELNTEKLYGFPYMV